MGLFDVLIAFVFIIIGSLILSFIMGALVSNPKDNKDNTGAVTMIVTFFISVIVITWGVFFI